MKKKNNFLNFNIFYNLIFYTIKIIKEIYLTKLFKII